MHTEHRGSVNCIITSIADMDERELDQLQATINRRHGELKQSTVMERRNHLNGILQLEYRQNPKTGTRRGPYW